jgi:hypothetical protein
MAAATQPKPSDFPVDRTNYFAEGQYLKTDIAKGVTRNRSGTRMISLTSDFLGGLRKAFHTECGPAAESVFRTCGKLWGKQFAERFDKELSEYYQMPVREFRVSSFLACLNECFSHHGWGNLSLDLDHHERGLIVAIVSNPPMAEIVGTNEEPVDSLLAGVLGAFFSHFTGETLDCMQTQCRAMGATESRFVIGLGSRLERVMELVKEGKSHEEILAELALTKG